MKYLIESKQGVLMGVYEGKSSIEALQEMYRDAGDDPEDARLQDWYLYEVMETLHHKHGALYVLEGGGCYVSPCGPIDGAGGGRYYRSLHEALEDLGFVEYDGRYVDIEAVRMLMDDELVEMIHGTLDTEQEFFDAYCQAHEKKYGQPFVFG